MTHSPDIEAAITWLGGLYQHAPEQEWVNVCMLDGRGHLDSEWAQVAQLHDLSRHISNFAQRGDVYFGVATRAQRLPGKERGSEADCRHVPGLWLDVDVADGTGAHKIANLPPSVDAAADLIRRWPIPVSGVVRSGHGLQPWWLLSEPLEASEAKPILARWQATWEQAFAGQGWHLDDVSDLPRIMRLPGTLNRKAKPPVPATFKADFSRRWQLSDLEELLVPERSMPAAEPRVRFFTGHLAGTDFNRKVPPGDVLEGAGCTLVDPLPGEEYATHYHWPGASHPKSFTVYPKEPEEEWPHATCWSESCAAKTGIPLRRPLDAFGLYAWLYHKGDFAEASRALVEQGFTDFRRPPEAPRRRLGALGEKEAMAVTPRETGWLWRPWLPAGKLVTLDGDPATGKSTMSLDLVARITKGGLMPDSQPAGGSGHVVLAAAEDDLEDTVIWRLMAAGADLSRVHYITEDFTLPADLERLEANVVNHQAVLLVIDVLFEYLSDGIDSYRDQSVRSVLRQVRAMAERTGVTVLMLRHFNKAPGGKAIFKGGGSIGVVGAARAGWCVGYHPEDESIRVLAPVKLNLAAMPQSLAFKLEPHEVYPCAYVHWSGPVGISADQLVGAGATHSEDGSESDHFCASILAQVLTNEWQWTEEVYAQIKEWGFHKKTLERARKVLGVEAKQFAADPSTGHERGWKIRMPTDPDSQIPDP